MCLLHAHLICGFVIFLVDGRGVLLMAMYLKMHDRMILEYLLAIITWQMLDFLPVMHYLCHIEVCDIISKNGEEHHIGVFI